MRAALFALAAMAATLGTTATADPWTDNTGTTVVHGAPPPGSSHETYYIVVNKFGKSIRGSSGTSVFQAQTGVYIATFPVDITNCVYVATLGRATENGGVDEDAGQITVVRWAASTSGVFVQTYGPRGTLAKKRNRPFHLLVAC